MNTHVAHALIAAMVAAVVSATAVKVMPAPQVANKTAALGHAWPGLSGEQKDKLAAAFKQISGLKLDIVCADASCSDLAEDVDDAAEKAGVNSQLDHAVFPLGYGMGVKADEGDDRARQVADAITTASGGALKPVVATDRMSGWVAIFIGKYERK